MVYTRGVRVLLKLYSAVHRHCCWALILLLFFGLQLVLYTVQDRVILLVSFDSVNDWGDPQIETSTGKTAILEAHPPASFGVGSSGVVFALVAAVQ